MFRTDDFHYSHQCLACFAHALAIDFGAAKKTEIAWFFFYRPICPKKTFARNGLLDSPSLFFGLFGSAWIVAGAWVLAGNASNVMRMREPIEWEVDSSLSESDMETADLRSFDPDASEAKRIIFDCIPVKAIVKLASASWSLLALASIPGAAQGHHVIFHAKGGDPLFLFRPNTYQVLCMSIEHIYMRPSRLKRYIE